MATPPAHASTAASAAITLTSKIPDFWTDQHRVWFIRTEATLAPQKLSDDARYDIVVSKLSKDAIQQVTDLLIEPPAVKKFDTLKAHLLAIYEESKNRQLQKLISEMELGEQKPSQLLRCMRELAKDKIPDDTLRILWQGHFSTVRAVLAVSETKELEHLSTIADNVFETTRNAQVSEVAQPQPPAISREGEIIMAGIAKLNLKVADLERSRPRFRQRWNNSRSCSTSRHRSRDPAAPRRTPDSLGWLCFYHHRFRSRARKCTEPCAWKTKQKN